MCLITGLGNLCLQSGKFESLLYSTIPQIIEALRFIPFRGFIHGDIKPTNIMVENNSLIAKLMDFGLVEQIDLTKPGRVKGTLNYIAPELLVGEKGDRRIDFFSLGVTILLTGKLSFNFKS